MAGNVYCFWHGLPLASTDSPVDYVDKDSGLSTEPACRDSSIPTEILDDESPPPPPAANVDDLVDGYRSIDADDKSGEEDVEDEDDDEEDFASEESTETVTPTLRNNPSAAPITCLVLGKL